MFRRGWSMRMVALLCLMMMAACGRSEGAAPATATSVPSAPTSPTSAVAATKPAATAISQQAGASGAAQAPATTTAIGSKGDPKSIVLGKPVMVRTTTARTVVAVEVKNTGDSYATFKVKAKQRSSTKPISTPNAGVHSMPAGVTWTITVAADEFGARDFDLLDLYVDGFFVVPQTLDPALGQKIKLGEPVVTIDGKQSRATVEVTNENEKRVSIQLHVLFVKDGVVTATAQLSATLEPGESRKLAPLVDGTPEGAVPQTQISNIGGF